MTDDTARAEPRTDGGKDWWRKLGSLPDDGAYIAAIERDIADTARPSGLLREAAERLAETRPKKEHGQLCPVWTHRLNKVRHAVTIAQCDCWILRDAMRDTAVIAAALAAAEPGLDVERHEHCAGCRGTDYLGRTCRGRDLVPRRAARLTGQETP